MVAEALRFIKSLEKNEIKPVSISVNFSARQFCESNLNEYIKELASSIGVNLLTGALEAEKIEILLLNDVEQILKILHGFKNGCIKIAIDDFGTDYFSLSYLVKLPISCLKVDRAFVVDLLQDNNARIVAESIIGLARNLKLNVVAEGVEELG